MSPAEAATPAIPYQKLPGDFRGLLRRNTLWLGGDHLLLVDSSRFSETYKRFYLRDIQTIVVRRTPRFALPYYWVLLALAALIGMLIGFTPFRQILFWPPFAVLAGVVIYLYAASMFQSCTCHLITRVNNVELPSLFRLRSAQRFVELMIPRLIAAQGELPADWVERAANLEDVATAANRNPDNPVELLPPGEFSWLNVAVFLLVLIDAGLTWLQLSRNDSTSLSAPNLMNMVALAICATFAIVRLSRQKDGRRLRTLVLCGLLVVAAVTYGSVLIQSFDQQFYHRTYKNMLQYAGMRPLGIIEIIADMVVAIPGLILSFRQKRVTA